ncbi:PP0621 family protein [Undibacterium sp. RuRC25W]|uniref:PP0621 family protein n=1 Tax=Undibacterium sp. RuRC25W TaxID=3413047 RepID=UPI003BF1BBC4
MKLLVWLILIVLVVLAIRKKAKPPSTPSDTAQEWRGATADSDAQPATESMVCCAHCQLYLPASEAIVRGSQSYCSTAHADLH